MKIIGLIAEYNPMHLGHIYQINKIKEMFPNSIIILITNATFSQRGEVNVINKWNKTKIALNNNIDLVIELPFAYATQSADIFAKGAIFILNKLKINTLIFGTESNNLEKINSIVNTQLYNEEYNKKVKLYMKTGLNYPTAMSKSLIDILGYTISEPNDLLAISYIKEIKRNKLEIKPVSIKRTTPHNSKEITNNIASASLIRNMIAQNIDITKYTPSEIPKRIYKNFSIASYFPYLKYKILTTNNLEIYKTVDEGMENRIKKFIIQSTTWYELVNNIKTKRYTYNKINRALLHILIGLQKSDNLEINYIRILGFNQQGKNYLNKIKKELDLKLITSYKPNISNLLDLELKATSIYALATTNELIEQEYKHPPIIKD